MMKEYIYLSINAIGSHLTIASAFLFWMLIFLFLCFLLSFLPKRKWNENKEALAFLIATCSFFIYFTYVAYTVRSLNKQIPKQNTSQLIKFRSITSKYS